MHEEASETKRMLKAVCKRVEAEETSKYEAMGEEAAEMRTQQECILSGGVYLHHRLRKSSFSPKKSGILEKHIPLTNTYV
jgi:hypothetical protein